MQIVRAGTPAHISANDKVLKRVSVIDGAVWGENARGRFDLGAGEHELVDVNTVLFSLTHATVHVSEVDGVQLRLSRLEERL